YWVPYNKGGLSKKWYGNLERVVNFSEKGRDFTRGKHQFSKYFFKPCFSWNYIGSSTPMARYYFGQTIWDVLGSSGFMDNRESLLYRVSLINSKVGKYLLNIINPTISFQVENIASIPVIEDDAVSIDLIDLNIEISKSEWDSHETSWDFQQNELLRLKAQDIDASIHIFL